MKRTESLGATEGGDGQVSRLEALLRRYRDSYYNGEGEVSDDYYDLLLAELADLDPKNPLLSEIGADDTDGFPKAAHRIPMGSQDKAANPEAFRAWAEKTAAAAYVVELKLDGASLELQYEEGRLSQALTRGNGIVGDDITRNVLRMSGAVPELDLPFTGGIRGEVVMSREVWSAAHQDKANCRNAANGIMRRKDGQGSEDLDIIVYDAAALGDDSFFANEWDKIAWLKARGFQVCDAKEFSDPEDIIRYRQEIAAIRHTLPFDIDGLVVKDRQTDMADLRRSRPERQIAFKFDLEVAVSILRDVEWSESGSTYTPIGIVDPVRLAGTTVQRANLNNPDMIRSLGLRIGSTVLVVKRGDIIPKIEGLAPGNSPGEEPQPEGMREIPFPDTCLSCGAPLRDEGTRLLCPNELCPKRQLHRIEKWVSVLGILELGTALLKQLFDTGLVRRIPDLYTLSTEQLKGLERMGERSAAKVIRHIVAPRELPLAAFIAGFDFEGIGELVIGKAISAGYDTLESLRGASLDDLAALHGLGVKTAQTILSGLRECAAEMDAILQGGIIAIVPPLAESPLRGVSVCFTGELRSMKRSQAEDLVRSRGGTVKKGVTADLSYLVTNDPESGSEKNVRARKLGIPILTEEEFYALAGMGG